MFDGRTFHYLAVVGFVGVCGAYSSLPSCSAIVVTIVTAFSALYCK